MDGNTFDRIVRTLVARGSRRHVLGLLSMLTLSGWLPTRTAELAEAAGRRKRRRKGHHHRHGDHKRHRKGKHKGKKKGKHTCTPEPTTVTCASRCAMVTNNCRAQVDCGPCACTPACPLCQTCDAATRQCVPVANGTACEDGLVCTTGETCQNGVCTAAHTCVDCTSTSQCPPHTLCDGGECRACDVCGSGCPFTSVQAAIDATPQLSTIRVCPGTYGEDAGTGEVVEITRSLRLIGAGDGADAATNTILKPATFDKSVVFIFENSEVELRGLRLTGGSGGNGDGLHIASSNVAVTDCTITGNTATGQPGGMLVGRGSQVTLTNTHITANTGIDAGGVFVNRGHLTLDSLSRVTGNTAGAAPGGILNQGGVVDLPSVDNVTGNISGGSNKNCVAFEGGAFIGDGAVCLTT